MTAALAPFVAPPLPPGRSRVVDGRAELFVREVGDGSPVVLLHGWMAGADLNWFSCFDPLVAAGHHVIAPDFRGHGRSSFPAEPLTLETLADDVAALMRELAAGPAVVVGYSMGSAVAQLVARRHPELVRGLVLGGGETMPFARRRQKVELRVGGWFGAVQRTTEGRWLARRLVAKAKRENPAIAAIEVWLLAELERGHPGALRAAGRALGRFDGRAASGVPTAVILTTHDHLVHPDRQRRLASVWKATVHELEADHDAPVARHVEFAATVVAAVADVVGRSPSPSGVDHVNADR